MLITNKAQFWKEFSRIWKVKNSKKAKLLFWRSYSGVIEETPCRVSDEEAIKLYEFHYETSEQWRRLLRGGQQWLQADQIFLEKWYWERGVGSDDAARLRYHLKHEPELAQANGGSDKLSWWEDWLRSEYMMEIDPNVQLF